MAVNDAGKKITMGKYIFFFAGQKKVCLGISFFLLLSFALPLAYAGDTAKFKKEKAVNVIYKLYKDFAWEVLFSDVEDLESVLGKSIAEQPRAVLEQYFDADLVSLLIRDASCVELSKGEECNLNFDPIFASQDLAAYNLAIHQLPAGNIAVEYLYPSNGKKIQMEYKVKYTTKGWRIIDIIYTSDGGSSLKKILQNKQRENRKGDGSIKKQKN